MLNCWASTFEIARVVEDLRCQKGNDLTCEENKEDDGTRASLYACDSFLYIHVSCSGEDGMRIVCM